MVRSVNNFSFGIPVLMGVILTSSTASASKEPPPSPASTSPTSSTNLPPVHTQLGGHLNGCLPGFPFFPVDREVGRQYGSFTLGNGAPRVKVHLGSYAFLFWIAK